MPSTNIQHILGDHFAGFRSERSLPKHVLHAAQQMMACRTRRLGGHVQRCPNGHVQRLWYNSCHHRSCPLCNWIRLETWLDRQKSRLIDCPHFHVVFTLPEELRSLWRYNWKLMVDLLFTKVRDTLFKLLDDPKYLGGKPGLVAALHTWGQTLMLHPHLHCLVTGGGMSPDGRWCKVVKKCLLPRKVLMIVFRGKYLAGLRRALDRGQLRLPPDTTAARLRGLLNKLGRATWNVKILERYDHGKGVLCYLARYVRGGPMSNRRLISCRDGQVRFRYKDNRDPDKRRRAKQKTMSLPVEQFLARLLQHVPRPGMHMVRSYGLYANSQKPQLEVAREQQGQGPIELPETLAWHDLWDRLERGGPQRCPVCSAVLVRGGEIPPCRDPPGGWRESSSEPAKAALAS